MGSLLARSGMRMMSFSRGPAFALLLVLACGRADPAVDAAASVAANKEVARRFFTEVWGGGSEAVAQELLSEAYVGHMTGAPAPLDRAGWLEFFRAFRVAFPDAQFTIEDVIGEGDRVVLRLTMRGTHQGVFNGIPPTGRTVQVTGVSIERVVEGRIVEGWVTNDALGMLQQLGVIPPPPPPA